MVTKKAAIEEPKAKPVKETTATVVAPKPAPAPQVPEKKDMLRKRELIERVALRTGAKKKDVKPMVEVLLAELGQALAAGRPCALPPLGRIVVNRQKELPDGRVVIAKVRQKEKSGTGGA